MDAAGAQMTNMCLSGGAEGADLQWGMTAGCAGHEVVHWSFRGHTTRAPKVEVVELTQDQLDVADPYLEKANHTLHRKLAKKSRFVKNLLRRNWYQVEHAERLYAVSEIHGVKVAGGTGWAVQMFIDRHQGYPCEAYVFDQMLEKWFVWKGEWVEITSPPKPYGIWAGIGTRDLNAAGKAAIRTLMEWSATDVQASASGAASAH
jgi:hypothetical protein